MITDIRQVIHFYLGQWVVIDSLPDNPNYQHWQKIEGYKLGEKYKIRGVGETSCWLENGSGTFPVPHQHLKLCLRFISGIDGASPEK